jgi:type IV pilus assembly protein PilM
VIPTPLDEVYLSYQQVPGPKGETHFFLATFPRNAADALLRTLAKAGVEAAVMDLAPLALCRVPNEPRAIVVSARPGCLDIMIIVERVPQVIRSLPLAVESPLSENMITITEELQRTIDFYNSSHQDKPLDATVPVLVSGELADAPETWQALAGTANYPVSALLSPLEFPEGAPVNDFAVKIGLALKGLPLVKEQANSSLVNFNALPRAYLPVAPSPVKILAPIGAVIGISVLAYIFILGQNVNAEIAGINSQQQTIAQRITQYQKDIDALKKQISQASTNTTTAKATAAELKAKLLSLQHTRDHVYQNLSEIIQLKPESVAVSQITYSSTATLTATAPNDEVALTYARNIRNSGRFDNVYIPSISTTTIANNVTVSQVVTIVDDVTTTTNVTSGPELIPGVSFQIILR